MWKIVKAFQKKTFNARDGYHNNYTGSFFRFHFFQRSLFFDFKKHTSVVFKYQRIIQERYMHKNN